MLNAYGFASVRSLRDFLRSYRGLEEMSDVTSVTILLDIRRALGDDPGFHRQVLTARQRQTIQLHLIENRSIADCVIVLNVHKRVVFLTERRALDRILNFLQQNEVVDQWEPWMLELLRNPLLSSVEIAQRIGKTVRAVDHASSKWRDRDRIPRRVGGRRNPGGKPKQRPADCQSQTVRAYLPT
jgi:hypothetical protein